MSVAVVVVLAALIATRILLIATSYDVVANWEEPVFLFSATELPEAGWQHLFDFQDDLNHGASLPLIVIAVFWVKLFGTSLVLLKGIAIVWSVLTLLALIVVAWRFFSPSTALVLALLYTFASPALARLNVTLVGSHPESVLPCTLLLGAYMEWQRRQAGGRSPRWLAFVVGALAGLSLWTAYVSLMWLAAIGLDWLSRRRQTAVPHCLSPAFRVAPYGFCGLLLGFSPWLIQNLWLRPHGAWLWRSDALSSTAPLLVVGTASSFGFGTWLDTLVCASCLLALLLATARILGQVSSTTREQLPIVLAAWFGLLLLCLARPPAQEGWYGSRFFIPEQVGLFWVVAFLLTGRWRTSVLAITVTAAAVLGIAGMLPLMERGNSYSPDLSRDRSEGCMVFGAAALPRAGTSSAAVADLERIGEARCRQRAFAGLGWGLAERVIGNGDFGMVRADLNRLTPGMRREACGGFYFVMAKRPGATPAAFDAARREVASLCETSGR
ncbi:MAG: hypothetical protein HY270_16315 [Deltaproteobacteria bacterium]|nr:hypothetical protein [Deltaproteobacteria bacterium]